MGKGREHFAKEVDHPAAGVLHEDQTRDPAFDGEPIDFAHLGGSQDLHAGCTCRARSRVMSSCNSGLPVQPRTASKMMRIISWSSRWMFLLTRSTNRSSPNISPYAFSGSVMPSV